MAIGAKNPPAQLGIVVLLHVRTTFVLAASAHVLVVRDKPCSGHRTPQDLLELGLFVEHLSIGAGEDVVRAVVAQRVFEKRDELVGDRKRILVGHPWSCRDRRNG